VPLFHATPLSRAWIQGCSDYGALHLMNQALMSPATGSEQSHPTKEAKRQHNREGVKNMHRQSCPGWDDCKKVTLTAS